MHVVFGAYELELDQRELRRAGEVVPLEPKAFKVLVYLLTHRHRAVSKSELLDTLWSDEYVTESALTRSVRLIRQAVGDAGHQQHVIKTLRGYGYRFVADVTLYPADVRRETASGRLFGEVLDEQGSEGRGFLSGWPPERPCEAGRWLSKDRSKRGSRRCASVWIPLGPQGQRWDGHIILPCWPRRM